MSRLLALEALTRDKAEQLADDLLPLIRLVNPDHANLDYLLAEQGGDIALHAKWDHSVALRRGRTILGLAMAYERQADDSPLYRVDELHIGLLAVSQGAQRRGYGSILLGAVLGRAIDNELCFTFSGERIAYAGLAVADDRPGAKQLYEAFGFREVGTKPKPQHAGIMHVMRARLSDIEASEKYQAARQHVPARSRVVPD